MQNVNRKKKSQNKRCTDLGSIAVQTAIGIVAARATQTGVGSVVGVGDMAKCVAPSSPVGIRSQPLMQQNTDLISLQWELVCYEAHPPF